METMQQMLVRAALENVLELLKHDDPFVRLQTSVFILTNVDQPDDNPQGNEAEAFRQGWEAAAEAMGVEDRYADAELLGGDDTDDEIDDTDEETLARRQALQAVPDTALLPATEENMAAVMSRLEQAGVGAEVPVEAMPPGYSPGQSGIGSGERKGTARRGGKRRHGRR